MIGARHILALVAACALSGAAWAETLQGGMQSLLDTHHADYGFPGATAAVALPDGSVVTAATGFADLEAKTPMTPDTRMLAARIGKSFVAATVLALETEGMLDRTDPVSGHLGDRDWFARLPNHATMTIADLLRHTSGLPDHVHLETFQADWVARLDRGRTAPTTDEAIAFVLDTRPLFPAGSGWSYSDTGYLLLGLIIEHVTGKGYYDIVTDRFLTRLGLDATAPSDKRRIPGLAVGCTLEGNPFGLPARTMDDAGRLAWDPAVEGTGGGLVSTSHDLAAWGHALFAGAAMDRPYLDRRWTVSPRRPMPPVRSTARAWRSNPKRHADRSMVIAAGSRAMHPACATMPITR